MKHKYSLSMLALVLGSQVAAGQSLKLDEDGSKQPCIMTAKDTVTIGYNAGFGNVAVLSNLADYKVEKVTTDADWLSFRKEKNGNLTFFSQYYYDSKQPRFAKLKLTSADGTVSRDLVVMQTINTSAEKVGDRKLAIRSAKASASQPGEGVERTYDDNAATLWHSPYGGGSFPFTLEYELAEASHVDYLVYTPRTDGNPNGNFGKVTVYYATKSAPSSFKKATEADCGMSSASSRIELAPEGVDNVVKIKIEVKSAGSNNGQNFASCAEMGFYEKDQVISSVINEYFADKLCTALKPGIDEAAVRRMPNEYLRMLAMQQLQGNYSTEFRVGTFGCYLTRSTLQNRYKVSCGYDNYENPTGIYFEKGEKLVIFAEGIDAKHPVSLRIKCFSNAEDIATEGQPESSYPLTNGMNVITALNRGNAYVAYYADDYEQAPQVKLHFALGTESGYFDAARHTNKDWVRILKNAKSDIIDILTQRLHVAAPVANLKSQCPKDAEKLAKIYDEVIRREREIMGMPQVRQEPKNHQFARPVAGGMFADGLGAAAAFGSFNEWVNPDHFGFWGFGHELGHNNQITPGFKWSGCGETTNNIYSAWVEHKVGAKDAYGTGYHRLEDEESGIGEYSGMLGGRFQVYLEEGVRKGISWQLQDGPDYHGMTPNKVTVEGQDADGKHTGTVTTTSRNYDHFVKVVPLWQLTLWTEECGKAPTTFGRMIESYRTDFDVRKFNTNGKQQIEMMKRFCDAAKVDFLDFFEKAGMLKPIHAYIEDYAKGWNIIDEKMIDGLKKYIAEKNYPKAPAALNYINAYNWETFRDGDKVLPPDTLNKGCRLMGNTVRVDNDSVPNAVGYETYNKKGELIRISMFGLRKKGSKTARYTYVLFPIREDADYIMAVGFDGTKVKCYQR